MRLILSLPVLVVVLAMVSEAATQSDPDLSSSIPSKLKELGSALEEKVRAAIEHIKQSDFPTKTRNWFSETYSKVKEKFKTTFS
ncbi:apolipoprotein C1 [Rhinolophus ferrumequinum]|uniref:Apolipoprotein C-I n=1 Tax=Rhinolophus ferrumequinum TaxID=59479 RepID=A0A671ED92_RHIFE|nr:apolipoprotein C-I [Rhinolophus ferrumequinum]KAF6287512.1 apolipoprotein C1 [Rhinolophus ferrumequinum]